jgi:hypothetical protein
VWLQIDHRNSLKFFLIISLSSSGVSRKTKAIGATFLARRRLPRATVSNWNGPQIIGVYAFKAADIETEFFRIHAASMMGIDPTDTAKEMFSDVLAELIPAQRSLALNHFQISRWHRSDDCSLAFA